MPDPFATAGAAARAIAAGTVGAGELVDAAVARIAAVNPTLNALVALDLDRARAKARGADAARAAGMALGALHGVPITVKESFDVLGLPSTFGRPEREGHVAGGTASAVRRLEAAGAIVLGKSNVPRDLADWQSYNEVYGQTRNPYDPARSPGGSSGGSAAALAAGLTCLELGSDIGGSIRIPAHFCGVYGHKPSYGVVPMRGHAMHPSLPPSDLAVAGPLARGAEDLALALDLVAGPEEGSPWQLSLPRAADLSLRGMRVALRVDDPAFPVDGTIRTRLHELADFLRREGALVTDGPELPMGSAEHFELYIALLRGATSARLTPEQHSVMRERATALPADAHGYEPAMLRGLAQSHREWLAAHARRTALRAGWCCFFERFDLLVCPPACMPAFPHMQDVPKTEQRVWVDGVLRPAADTYHWLGLASVAYLPATVMPLGLSAEGLPVGAQVIGPEFADHRCIRFAGLVERGFGGFTPPPLFS